MRIPQEIKQQACEGLLHFCPKKRLSRELGVSSGAIRDWSIYIDHGFFHGYLCWLIVNDINLEYEDSFQRHDGRATMITFFLIVGSTHAFTALTNRLGGQDPSNECLNSPDAVATYAVLAHTGAHNSTVQATLPKQDRNLK